MSDRSGPDRGKHYSYILLATHFDPLQRYIPVLRHERFNCRRKYNKVPCQGRSRRLGTAMDHQFTHTVFSFYLCSLALDVLFIILMISFVTLCVAFFTLWPDLNFALSSNSSQGPVTESIQGKCSFELPIQRRRTAISGGFVKRGAYSGSTGLGDYLDLCVVAFYHRPSNPFLCSRFYSVSIAIGKTVTAVNLGMLYLHPKQSFDLS